MSDVFLLIVDIRHPVSGCNLTGLKGSPLYFTITLTIDVCLSLFDEKPLLVSSSVALS